MYNSIKFICIIILLCSCNDKQVDIPDTGRKIVINGLITDDEPINISISKSGYLTDLGGINSLFFKKEDNLKVLVYENDIRIDSLTPEEYYEYNWFYVFNKGNYKSNSTLFPSSGNQYRIETSLNDFPDAVAITTIPNPVKIEKIDTSRVLLLADSDNPNKTGFRFRLVFTDPPSRENFYMVRMFFFPYYKAPYEYLNSFKNNDLLFSSDDPIIEERIRNINGLVAVAFSDKLINGFKHYLDLVIKGEAIGEPIVQFNYPQNAYSVHRKAIHIKLYSISEEYFKYIKTLQQYSRNYSNPFTEPVLMDSNVSGGYGMLSGASVSSDSIIFILQ